MTLPAFCRPLAYRTFAQALPDIEQNDGLLRAAVAIAMHEIEDVTPEQVNDQLAQLAAEISGRVHSNSPSALLAHAHDVLFDRHGFSGNTSDYYDPHNSYLPSVLASKQGLPITLALIYKLVLERIGLTVLGINAPGHFMARVELEAGPLLIDPFAHGRVLSFEEACERASAATSQSLPHTWETLPIASHRAWISRMQRNLYSTFLEQGRDSDVSAISELARLLKQAGAT